MTRTLPLWVVALSVLGANPVLARGSVKHLSASSASTGLSLAARAESAGYAGYLTEEPARFGSTRLTLSGGAWVRQAQVSIANGLSRPELEAEYRQLDENEPGLGLPIALITCGGVGTLASLWVIILGLAYSPPVAVIGVVVLAASVALGVSGGIMLGRRIHARIVRTRRMNEIDEQLKGNDGSPPAAPYNVRRDLDAPGSAGYQANLTLASF